MERSIMDLKRNVSRFTVDLSKAVSQLHETEKEKFVIAKTFRRVSIRRNSAFAAVLSQSLAFVHLYMFISSVVQRYSVHYFRKQTL